MWVLCGSPTYADLFQVLLVTPAITKAQDRMPGREVTPCLLGELVPVGWHRAGGVALATAGVDMAAPRSLWGKVLP